MRELLTSSSPADAIEAVDVWTLEAWRQNLIGSDPGAEHQSIAGVTSRASHHPDPEPWDTFEAVPFILLTVFGTLKVIATRSQHSCFTTYPLSRQR